MTGHYEDGKYMWDVGYLMLIQHLAVTIDSKQLNQVATHVTQLGQTAPYFDQNDGIIQKQEMEKAAFAVANPPSPDIKPPIPPIPRVNGSDFEQQEEGKPWQITILIIIMACLEEPSVNKLVKSMKRQLNLKAMPLETCLLLGHWRR